MIVILALTGYWGAELVYAMVSCLVVNDAVKDTMIHWRVPAAVAYGAARSIGQGAMPPLCLA